MAAPAPQHRVQRLVVELHGTRRAEAGALQAAAQRQVQQRLLPLIDSLCTRLGDAQAVQRIDRLEIDLGAWPAAAWADDGPGAQDLQAHLEAALARALGPALQTAAAVQTDVELVASCLRTGQLPWWADPADRGALRRALAALLAQPVQPGQAWLPPADADAPALQRLVAALDDAQLADLACRLQAQPGAAAVPWPTLLAAIARPLGLAPARLRQAWWCEALAAALQPGQPEAQALAQALQRLPARLGLATTAVASAWRRALDQAAGQLDAAVLAPLWQALGQGWPVDRPAMAGAVADPVADTTSGGLAPVAPAQPHASARAAADAALAGLAAWLASRPAGDAARRWLPWMQVLRQPVSGQALPQWAAWLSGAAPAAAMAAALQEALSAAPLPPGASPAQRPAAAAALAALLQAQAHRPAPPPSQAPAVPVPVSDALYLANAGLVLLWPFMQRFADRLGLLQARQFHSPAHAARLAVLLQCVGTGDADPPEFQLPLNKLLCGLPLEAAILLDEPITPAEQDECADLLGAVLQTAPVLGRISHDGLRQAFLQRPGQLLTQDGHWLLRVERATHDVLIDRLPWSPAIVRLPWMPQLLQVQW